MNKAIYKKKLSNKNPTKDISKDDLKYKIPKSVSKNVKIINLGGGVVFSKKNIPIIAGPNGVEGR